MDNNINTKKETDLSKTRNENQEQYRVVINKEASEGLEKMLAKVTDGFDAGSVNKSDVANWLIQNAANSFSDSDVKAIQKLHFDERKILGAILKDSKSENKIPESVKKAIREHFGLTEGTKRRTQDKSREEAQNGV
jgi:hypothetical protein